MKISTIHSISRQTQWLWCRMEIGYYPSPSRALRFHSSAERLFLALAGHPSPEWTKQLTHINDFNTGGKILWEMGFVQ